MATTHYDPETAPDAKWWHSLDEAERVRLVQNHHVAIRTKVQNIKAHAAMHAIVENQIAIGYGPTKRAIVRLQQSGLSRHDALHSIGSVIARFMFELNQQQTEEQKASFQSRMNEAIEALRA